MPLGTPNWHPVVKKNFPLKWANPVHMDTVRLIMTQNLSPRTEPRSWANDFPSPPPSLSFEPVSISLGYIMDSFQNLGINMFL